MIGRHNSYVYAHYTTVRNQSDRLIQAPRCIISNTLVNLTMDAVEGLSEQLVATSRMTYQNRLALYILLAEQEGVCIG